MPIDPSTITFYIITLAILPIIQFILTLLNKPRQRFKPTPEGPRCQGCGYILYTNPLQLCPECGRDPSPDRLLQQSPPKPTPPVSSILAASILLFPLTIAAAYPIAARFPQTWRGEATHIIPTPAGDVTIMPLARGRGSIRKIRDAMVLIPSPSGKGLFGMNLADMTLSRKQGSPIPINRKGILSLLAPHTSSTPDPATLAAADQIVDELNSLQANRWPDDRFKYEMTGHYAITPDDLGGPFFWLPTYTPACIPIWLILSITTARQILKRHRAAIKTPTHA